MLVLAFVWLALFVREMLWGGSPLLAIAGHVIWGIFVFDFALGLVVAPAKLAYLRGNWFKAVALLAPALGVLRFVRIVRVARLARAAGAVRGVRIVRALGALNRGMRALRASVRRRGFGYVVGTTLVVTVIGAAGMFAFERENPDGLRSYGDALWWTVMVMTTLGSEYWPKTPEGRVLCVFLALYAFAVFGYVTATLATFFIGREAEDEAAELAGTAEIAKLREEIRGLREEIRALSARSSGGEGRAAWARGEGGEG
jgi:voltage-gated potassium channel